MKKIETTASNTIREDDIRAIREIAPAIVDQELRDSFLIYTVGAVESGESLASYAIHKWTERVRTSPDGRSLSDRLGIPEKRLYRLLFEAKERIGCRRKKSSRTR